jgi:hypothetical protein
VRARPVARRRRRESIAADHNAWITWIRFAGFEFKRLRDVLRHVYDRERLFDANDTDVGAADSAAPAHQGEHAPRIRAVQPTP